MLISALIFDLDGTLLDTLTDIASAANSVLESEGLPAHPAGEYRQLVGEGVIRLFQKALPADRQEAGLVDRCVAEFRVAYSKSWNVHTRAYEGIAELLDALQSRGLGLSVLSNKPDEFTQRYIEAYLSKWSFRAVLGHRDGQARKPDPAGALEIAERLGVSPERFLFLGDSAIDMETARRAGMHPIGAAWGFRSREELLASGAEVVIEHPLDLIGLIDRARACATY
jgi:phosphoglycolate phosphatase